MLRFDWFITSMFEERRLSLKKNLSLFHCTINGPWLVCEEVGRGGADPVILSKANIDKENLHPDATRTDLFRHLRGGVVLCTLFFPQEVSRLYTISLDLPKVTPHALVNHPTYLDRVWKKFPSLDLTRTSSKSFCRSLQNTRHIGNRKFQINLPSCI